VLLPEDLVEVSAGDQLVNRLSDITT